MHIKACLTLALVFCVSNTAIAVPLWEIEGTSNRIRLLGSVHFLRAQDYPLPDAITAAYQEADIIVLELALDEITLTDMLRVQQELAVDPRGRGLSDLIDARSYREAQSLASATNINLDILQPFEPWFAALQITQLRLLQLGFDGSYGIDATMSRMARTDGKTVIGLETLDEQLRALDTLPAKAQQSFLLQTLEDVDEISDQLEIILAAWRQGDTNTLENLLLEGLSEQPEVYDQLLVQRNQRWTKAIIDMTNDSQDYLIIVGSLHLVGKDSVQSMLEQAGITTRQLR
jgi:uncharacterized protein YbaP (TraB family)